MKPEPTGPAAGGAALGADGPRAITTPAVINNPKSTGIIIRISVRVFILDPFRELLEAVRNVVVG